jgi:hypothetical protein
MAEQQQQTEPIDAMFKRLAGEWRRKAAMKRQDNTSEQAARTWDGYAQLAEQGRFPHRPCDPALLGYNAERLRASQAGRLADA